MKTEMENNEIRVEYKTWLNELKEYLHIQSDTFTEINIEICEKLGIEFTPDMLLSEMVDKVNTIIRRDIKITDILNG